MLDKSRELLIMMLLQHTYMIWDLVNGYVRIVNGKEWVIRINRHIILLQILLMLQIIGINTLQQVIGLIQ